MSVTIFCVDLECHVLDNGQRVISEESMGHFLEAMSSGTISELDIAETRKILPVCEELLKRKLLRLVAAFFCRMFEVEYVAPR